MMCQLLKQIVCPVWGNMNQSTRINSSMYHQQRFYTNNEGLNDKLEPDEIAQYQGILTCLAEPRIFRLESQYTDLTKEIINMKGNMNMKFAEQSGKMKVMQYQLGAAITLITVIGRFIGLTVKRGVDVFIEQNSGMVKVTSERKFLERKI